MFVLCSLFVFDFLFSPKLRGLFLYFFSSSEVFPDGAVFSRLRPLTAQRRVETRELDVSFHQDTLSLNKKLLYRKRQTFSE